jgi:hypothetical protein
VRYKLFNSKNALTYFQVGSSHILLLKDQHKIFIEVLKLKFETKKTFFAAFKQRTHRHQQEAVCLSVETLLKG